MTREEVADHLRDIAAAPRWVLPDPMFPNRAGLTWTAVPTEFVEKLDRLVAALEPA